jgi:hypothetical protein
MLAHVLWERLKVHKGHFELTGFRSQEELQLWQMCAKVFRAKEFHLRVQ